MSPAAGSLRCLHDLCQARFIMLRFETPLTRCTGITAVNQQERLHFHEGVTVAPWCPALEHGDPASSPLRAGLVRRSGWEFPVNGATCRVLESTDASGLIIFLEIEGRFRGRKSPYDTPPDSPGLSPESALRTDSLWFGLAVRKLLEEAGARPEFIWGADWETVPALELLRSRHVVALTLHNTYDECLAAEAAAFGDTFGALMAGRASGPGHVTALELGLSIADVVTTVNRGFAWGMRHEPLQREVMAAHLSHLLSRVVGIDNAAFTSLDPELLALRDSLLADFGVGGKRLFALQERALAGLQPALRRKAEGKVLVATVGRRVSQKMHDLVVESVRKLLDQDPETPILALFLTTHGDSGSPARLERIRSLAARYPENVLWTDGPIPEYGKILRAAHFVAMPSLWEPHGAVFDGSPVPIARAVDGPAAQICAFEPRGEAARMNALWHSPFEEPSGLLFREPAGTGTPAEWRALLTESPSPDNPLFRVMRDSLTEVLGQAIDLKLKRPEDYARLVLGALQRQARSSWEANLGGMLALIEEARARRRV